MTDTEGDEFTERVDERPSLAETDRPVRTTRRSFLWAASMAVGAGPLSGRVGGTDRKATHGPDEKGAEQPLETAVYTGPGGVGNRPFVVYREPEPDERTICTASVSWRHRIVVLPQTDDQEPIYTDLYAAERYPAGSVLELVDRLSACPRSEGALLFVRRVANPEE